MSVSSLGTTGTGLVSGVLDQSGENIVLRAAAEEIFPYIKFLSDFDLEYNETDPKTVCYRVLKHVGVLSDDGIHPSNKELEVTYNSEGEEEQDGRDSGGSALEQLTREREKVNQIERQNYWKRAVPKLKEQIRNLRNGRTTALKQEFLGE